MEKLGIEFRLLIAYLIPGIVLLYASTFYSTVTKTLLFGNNGIPDSAAVIPIILLGIGAGIIVNAITWAIVRPFIELTSVTRPELNYANLTESDMHAFQIINDENFRYYQSYSNLFTSGVALIVSYALNSTSLNSKLIIISLIVMAILFFASRDSLKRAYNGMESLIGKTKENDMTNGIPAPQPTASNDIEQKDEKNGSKKIKESSTHSDNNKSKEVEKHKT